MSEQDNESTTKWWPGAPIADLKAHVDTLEGIDPLTAVIIKNYLARAYDRGWREGFAKAESIMREEA